MKGFTSKEDFTRYGNLYALSCLLSSQDFWFCGDLYEACEAKDFEKLRKHLIKSYPPIWEFSSVIDWKKLTDSAITVYDFGNKEHNLLLERLGLVTLPSPSTHH